VWAHSEHMDIAEAFVKIAAIALDGHVDDEEVTFEAFVLPDRLVVEVVTNDYAIDQDALDVDNKRQFVNIFIVESHSCGHPVKIIHSPHLNSQILGRDAQLRELVTRVL
jgi:hypothetical protein